MKIVLLLLGAFVLLALVYLFLIAGRRGNPGLKALRSWEYAHRGLHGEGVPENSLAAFRAAAEAGYGIELDLHLLRDGSLGVMHDSVLKRTTGREGRMEELTAADLKSYSLGGTAETIPEFREVLKLLGGSVPMVIELKTDGDNFNRLAETACRALEGYEGLYCIESFDPRCIRWLKKNWPRIVRGQLSDNFLREESGKASLPLRFVVTFLLSDCLTRPDFIAYHFPYRGNLSVRANGMLGVQRVGWTIRSQQELDIARKKGWIPIFEGFTPKP